MIRLHRKFGFVGEWIGELLVLTTILELLKRHAVLLLIIADGLVDLPQSMFDCVSQGDEQSDVKSRFACELS
jgi:hypothetical protein